MDLSITLVPEAFFYYRHFLFGSLRREAPSREKRKPLVKIVENLTSMLAQHLTAIKDVIFFLPVTSPKIFNPSTHMTRRKIKRSGSRRKNKRKPLGPGYVLGRQATKL